MWSWPVLGCTANAGAQVIRSFAQLCADETAELREIADYFDVRGNKINGDFLRNVANKYEYLARVYHAEHNAEKDAERYQWLRSADRGVYWDERVYGANNFLYNGELAYGDDLDAAIDREIHPDCEVCKGTRRVLDGEICKFCE